MAIAVNSISCGRCEDLIPGLADKSIQLVFTSPPYANQRDGLYEGISEKEYPAWMVKVMQLIKPKLSHDGSVLINIRPHLSKGVISDYVLKTRLALREDGWNECEEFIWLKPDAPPLGSIRRPRRNWESILWFGKEPEPYCDLRAVGHESDRVGFGGSTRFGIGGDSPLHEGQHFQRHKGTARIPDVITAYIGEIAKNVMHPAMFPITLPLRLIPTFSRAGDVVFDPFAGSGTTLIAAKNLGRDYIGFDRSEDYCKICQMRLVSDECIF